MLIDNSEESKTAVDEVNCRFINSRRARNGG